MSPPDPTVTLRFFGAGGAFSRRYGTTCSMITLRDGQRWLVDCGRQAPEQLHAAGVRWRDIDGQIVTHCHGDHVYGLEELALVRFDARRAREPLPLPRLVAHHAVQGELWEILAPSLRHVPGGHEGVSQASLRDFFEVVPAADAEAPRAHPWNHAETFDLGAFRVVARESEHVPSKPSCSIELHVDDPGAARIAWWSGDCTVDADYLCSLEERTSVYFHDCTFMDYPGQVHGFFDALAALPERIRRKMVIMHHDDGIEQSRARVEAAGMRIALPGHVYDLVRGQRIG